MSKAIRQNLVRFALWGLAATVLCGCGYHFAASGSGIPAQDKTIYVERFRNRTRYTGVNDQFMLALKDEIANHKRLRLVDDPKQADLVLSGEIFYINALPVTFNAVNEPTLYTQTMSANADLVDTHTHKTIWSSSGITAGQNYAVVSQSVVTTSPIFLQQNQRSKDIANMTDIQVAQTQQYASQRMTLLTLAQNLYASMSEGF
ncbi:MAG: LPS assembly lipoprotein LptE [Candidatus Binataceae bacterium]